MALAKTNEHEFKSKSLDVARVERSTALADGLFTPMTLVESKRTSMKYKVYFKLKEFDYIAEWRGIQLDSVDLNVFLALSKLASIEDNRIIRNSSNCLQHWKDQMDFEGRQKESIPFFVIRTSFYEILKEAGYTDSGKNYKKVYDSVLRMCSMRLHVFSKEQENKTIPDLLIGSSLFGNLTTSDGRIAISYNPMVMAMINGYVNGCLIDMALMKSLKTDVSKKAFFWLSAWASHDRFQSIKLDTLVNHVWSNKTVTNELVRKRRFQLKKSLDDISNLGWIIKIDGDMCKIKRPKI